MERGRARFPFGLPVPFPALLPHPKRNKKVAYQEPIPGSSGSALCLPTENSQKCNINDAPHLFHFSIQHPEISLENNSFFHGIPLDRRLAASLATMMQQKSCALCHSYPAGTALNQQRKRHFFLVTP
ncbi:MAG: hypothetical protein ACOY4H_15305 [Thermodesulfobacteriota bacterium]